MKRKHSSIEDVIADLRACAKQYHDGLRLEPQTIGHVLDMFAHELSFYVDVPSDGKRPSCNSHERIHEDGSGYICRHCGIDMDDED